MCAIPAIDRADLVHELDHTNHTNHTFALKDLDHELGIGDMSDV